VEDLTSIPAMYCMATAATKMEFVVLQLAIVEPAGKLLQTHH
jgi:hypothetical protein